MECYICGYELPESANFCPNCGRKCSAPEQSLLQQPSETEIAPAEPEAPSEGPVMTDIIPEEALEPDIPVPEYVAPGSEEPPLYSHNEEEDDEPPRKRRPLLVPSLILAGMFLCGMICFWLFPFADSELPQTSTPAVQSPTLPDLPQRNDSLDESETETHAYTPADEECFELTGGAVRFIPSKYDGGTVLVIPDEIGGKTVTEIADYGFANCDNITTIILPNHLKTIGSYAFNGCNDLRGVYLPESVQEIGRGAFNWCVSLEAVSISTGVKTIGADAFDGCASLMYFFYSGTYEEWVALYNEYVTPFTYVSCTDGDYYHGVYIP